MVFPFPTSRLLALTMAASVISGCVGGSTDGWRVDPPVQASAAAPDTTRQAGLDEALEHVRVAVDPICPRHAVRIEEVVARVRAENGAPIKDRPVSICGNLCFAGTTDAEGTVRVRPSACFQVDPAHPLGAVLTVFGVGVGPSVTLPLLPVADRPGVMAPPVDVVMPSWPANPRGLDVDPAGHLTLRDLDGSTATLSLEAGSAAGGDLRMARVPRDATVRDVASSGEPIAIWALDPVGGKLAEPMDLSLANVTKLEPGTRVEILAVGTGAMEGRPPAGVLGVIGTGHVDAQGAFVVPDERLTAISWVGYRVPAATR